MDEEPSPTTPMSITIVASPSFFRRCLRVRREAGSFSPLLPKASSALITSVCSFVSPFSGLLGVTLNCCQLPPATPVKMHASSSIFTLSLVSVPVYRIYVLFCSASSLQARSLKVSICPFATLSTPSRSHSIFTSLITAVLIRDADDKRVFSPAPEALMVKRIFARFPSSARSSVTLPVGAVERFFVLKSPD